MTSAQATTGVRYWMSLWDNSLMSKAYAEFMGCMVFHFIGSVCPTPIANAVALTTMVFYTAKISGGHLNPALSLTFCILGHTDPLEMIVYWMAQVSGCIVGAMWIAALMPGLLIGQGLPDPPYDRLVGCIEVQRGLDKMQVMGWEAFSTFCFIMPVFSVVWYTQNKSGYGSTGPIMVGIALYAVALATGDWTGALVNPARTIGSDLIFSCKQSHYIREYISGQIIGAVLAPLAIVPWYGLSARPWYYTLSSSAGKSVVIPEKRYSCATPVWAVDEVGEERGSAAGASYRRIRLFNTRPADTDVTSTMQSGTDSNVAVAIAV